MENGQLDETTLLAIIGLLLSILIAVSVLFGMTYFYDIRHDSALQTGACNLKNDSALASETSQR